MARQGSFAGAEFVLGAPLLSVHPIDNRFPDLKDEDGAIQPIDEDQEPDTKATKSGK